MIDQGNGTDHDRAARTLGDIVALIDEIAGQVSLLALKATIAATRAAEAGAMPRSRK